MSQTEPDAVTDDSTDSQTDDAFSLADRLAGIRDRLEELEDDELSDMDDVSLVELRTELKELEDTVEDVRKEQADSELETRVEPGESLYGLNRIQSHSKYVEGETGKIVMNAVSEGIDWTQFVSIDASSLADVAPEIAEIGRYEYTYFR